MPVYKLVLLSHRWLFRGKVLGFRDGCHLYIRVEIRLQLAIMYSVEGGGSSDQ